MKESTILDRIHSLLRRTQPFDQLDEATHEEIMADLAVEYFKEGEVILEQGGMSHKGLYVVESGTVRLMDVQAQRLIDICGEGDTFGSFGLLKGGAHIYEAKATEPTVCALVKGERFQALYDAYPHVKAFFDRDLRQYVRHLGSGDMDVVGSHLLFSRRLNRLAFRPPVVCAPDTTAKEAAQLMTKAGNDVVLVQRGDRVDGLFTDADLRRRLIARGRSMDTPAKRFMSAPVHTISGSASLFEAITTMLRQSIQHLVVQDADGSVLGVLSDRDIAHFRGQDPLATVRRVEYAQTVDELAGIRTEMTELLLRLYRQDVQPEALGLLMTLLYDRLIVQMLRLAERRLRAQHAEAYVDLPWAWMRLGEGGRQEMSLVTEQHNAIVYADPATDADAEKAEAWFGLLADAVHDGLAACGFATSRIVARNARWRMPLGAWRKTYRTWVHEALDEDLAEIPFALDLRGLYGDTALVDALKETIEDALNVQELDRERRLLARMAAHAIDERPPLSFFRRFVVERSGEQAGRLNLFQRGLLPVVDAARVLALDVRYLDSTSTYDRLRHVAEAWPEWDELLHNALDAYRYLADFHIESQLRAFEAGEAPSYFVDPITLTKLQRNLLRSAFAAVAELQTSVARRYNVARLRRTD